MDQLQVCAPGARVVGVVHLSEQQLSKADDHREGVVEVVRDAAGKLAQCLKPLLADHHFLGVLNVGERLL